MMNRPARPASIPRPIQRVRSTTTSVTKPASSRSAASPPSRALRSESGAMTCPTFTAAAISTGPRTMVGSASTTPSQNLPLLDRRDGGGCPGGSPYGGGGGCWDTSSPARSGQEQVDAGTGRDSQQHEIGLDEAGVAEL